MLTNEKKNALYECYLSMRQSNSNAVLNCGNGKNVSVAEYNGIYIIRNDTKDAITSEGDGPTYYVIDRSSDDVFEDYANDLPVGVNKFIANILKCLEKDNK